MIAIALAILVEMEILSQQKLENFYALGELSLMAIFLQSPALFQPLLALIVKLWYHLPTK